MPTCNHENIHRQKTANFGSWLSRQHTESSPYIVLNGLAASPIGNWEGWRVAVFLIVEKGFIFEFSMGSPDRCFTQSRRIVDVISRIWWVNFTVNLKWLLDRRHPYKKWDAINFSMRGPAGAWPTRTFFVLCFSASSTITRTRDCWRPLE